MGGASRQVPRREPLIDSVSYAIYKRRMHQESHFTRSTHCPRMPHVIQSAVCQGRLA